ncbi:MAG: DUF3226 domain-containing protein [Chloroherpetonaceae bacterium]|nr:DUF3226 domain-containing protein [Chloroherpetonaceae bacterium]
MISSSDRKTRTKHLENLNPLLVEGNDDLYLTGELADQAALPDCFYIHVCDGYPKILSNLETRLKAGTYQKLGVVLDADTNISKKWVRIKEILEKYGFVLEGWPNGKAYIESNKSKKIGIWIMPDNNTEGELEDFFLGFIPKKDDLIRPINEALDRLEKEKLNRYTKRTKALVLTWLAWQEESGMPMGKSIKNYPQLLDLSSANGYINWLKTLFEDEVLPASIS